MKDFVNSKLATAITLLIIVAAMWGVALMMSHYPQTGVFAVAAIGTLGTIATSLMKGLLSSLLNSTITTTTMKQTVEEPTTSEKDTTP